MYFIIRDNQADVGPLDNVDQARAVPGPTNNDKIVRALDGLVRYVFTAGDWAEVWHSCRVTDKIQDAMRCRVLAHEKANALHRRNDAEQLAQEFINDMVNAPPHYNQAGIECLDAIAAATSGKTGIQAVCVANVVKYLWRYELKNGVEDVKKARWYLDRLIGDLEK